MRHHAFEHDMYKADFEIWINNSEAKLNVKAKVTDLLRFYQGWEIGYNSVYPVLKPALTDPVVAETLPVA